MDAGTGPQIRDDEALSKRRETQPDSKWNPKPSCCRQDYCLAQGCYVLSLDEKRLGWKPRGQEKRRCRRELLKKQVPFPGALPPQTPNDVLLEEGP